MIYEIFELDMFLIDRIFNISTEKRGVILLSQKEIRVLNLNHYTLYKSRNISCKTDDWKITYYRLETYKNNDGFIYYLLYNTEGRPIKEFFKYLNVVTASKGVAMRKKTAYSLKRLYECIDIYDVDIDKLDSKFISVLTNFFRGGILDDREITKNDQDIKIAIDICIKYLNHEGYKVKTNHFKVSPDKSPAFNNNRLSVKQSDLFVPEYVSDNEYKKLISVMRNFPRKLYTEKFLNEYKDNLDDKVDEDLAILLGIPQTSSDPPKEDLESILIVTLMFTCGFRIGEVLGLTTEDIRVDSQKKCIVLRNRLSDEQYQYAKNLGHPKSNDDYKKAWYKRSGGTCLVAISDALYESIVNYIDRIHKPYLKAYNSPTLLADRVEEETEGVNHYLFMNTTGDRLTIANWNNILRKYFDKAGIKRDRIVKHSNLNHRFRHSYAIRIVNLFREANKTNPDNPPFGVADLARAMRHKSLETCLRYFSWTEEHASQVLEDFSQEFIDQFPAVLEVFNSDINKGDN